MDHVCYFPAYHMNKTYWFSVLLDQKLSWEQLQRLIDESYQLVNEAK
ncbi:MmcQ/YjbR family DNA-binding protein [[Clostridium] innocuum]|nr:MmcQ/YjbR family DNA-binding protein [[Clostridium] innocuum]